VTLGVGTARLLLVPILLAFVYITVGYARGTPRWNNPDEPAHVNVIRYIAQTGRLPVLVEGDWDANLLSRLTTAWFPNDYEVDGIRYESHQPPLYYLLAAPVHRLTQEWPLNRQIMALRFVSILLGAIGVAAAFVVGREVAPDEPVIAVLVASTVAFVPMYTAISAAVNNDALANTLAAVTLAALMVGQRRGFSDRWAIGLGVLVGAIVLTKLTIYVYVPLILGTLLLAGRQTAPEGSRWWHVLRWPAIAAGVGLLVSGWWLVRNALVYSPTDILALHRHDAIVVGQPRWTSYDLEGLDYFLRIVFRSFWGMFGWMGVVLDDGFYILYLVLTVLAVVGVLLGTLLPSPPNPLSRKQERGLIPYPSGGLGGEGQTSLRHRGLLAVAAGLVVGEVVYYNLTFIQPQGRYLFPALVPIAVFLSRGWWQLARGATAGPVWRTVTAGALAAAIAWALGEVHGSLRAPELWSDNALIAAGAIGALVVAIAPRTLRQTLPVALCLMLAVSLALLDYAALVKFVAPAFPARSVGGWKFEVLSLPSRIVQPPTSSSLTGSRAAPSAARRRGRPRSRRPARIRARRSPGTQRRQWPSRHSGS
jgi:4-amino-4-deoxy-L-arabinose transferase-like glycosyltransferase